MMDRLEKRIDEKIDSKLVPVMDRLSVLEKPSSSKRSDGGSTGQSSSTLALLLPCLLLVATGNWS